MPIGKEAVVSTGKEIAVPSRHETAMLKGVVVTEAAGNLALSIAVEVHFVTVEGLIAALTSASIPAMVEISS